MNKLVIFSLFILSFLFSSCEIKEITLTSVEKIKVNKLGKEGIDIDIIAKINNPNKSSFTIFKSDMDVEMSGLKMGVAHLSKNVKIKGNSEQDYTFNIKSDFTNINIGELPNLLGIFMKRSVNLKMKGEMKVGKFLLRKKIPVDFNKNIPLSGMMGQ